jgi:hypothetical protein
MISIGIKEDIGKTFGCYNGGCDGDCTGCGID